MIRAGSSAALSSAAEAVVVALAAGGDDAAFTELVRRRQPSLRSLLLRLTREPALADDLAQQAFIVAWQKLPQLRLPGAFAGWPRDPLLAQTLPWQLMWTACSPA